MDTNGQVRAIREGTATIQVSATDGSKVSKNVNVTVRKVDVKEDDEFLVDVNIPESIRLNEYLKVHINVKNKSKENIKDALVEAVFAGGKKVSTYTDSNGNVNLYIPTNHIKENGSYKLDIKISGDILKNYLKSFDINIGCLLYTSPSPRDV